MIEIETLKTRESPLTVCPALVVSDAGDPVPCEAELRVVLTADLRGDDYGSWTEYWVGFACGHTLADMEAGLRMAEYV